MNLKYIPDLTCPIYKGQGKDPPNPGDVTLTSVPFESRLQLNLSEWLPQTGLIKKTLWSDTQFSSYLCFWTMHSTGIVKLSGELFKDLGGGGGGGRRRGRMR